MKTKTLTKKSTALLLCMLALGTSAHAAEPTFKLDQVVVTADRTAATIAATPANVTTVTADEIAAKGATTLSDALTGVSGIYVQNAGSRGEMSTPYILGTERIVLMIDGKRMNIPQGTGFGAGGINLNTIALPANIDRIEIVRGASSALYGADAVGGVINIITKTPSKTDSTITAAAGSYGGRLYSLTSGGKEGATAWHIAAGQERTDGQRANSIGKFDNVSLALNHDLSATEQLAFSYDYYDGHAGMPGSLTYPSLSDYYNLLRNNWSIGYTAKHDGGERLLRYYNNQQKYSGQNFGYFRHQNKVQVFEYQDGLKNTHGQLTWGGEWRKEEVNSSKHPSVHDGTTKAVFLQQQYRLNPLSSLTVGLRYNNNDTYGNHWLPKIAYHHQATPKVGYFANWGKVFRAPNFDDLYADYGWGMSGNPNLKAETGWVAELGTKISLSAKNEATVTLFKRNLSDAIKWQFDPVTFGYNPYNIDRLTTTGINANLTSKLSSATTLDLGYTYLDSRNQNQARIGDPRHSINIGLTAKAGRLTQSVYSIYTDKTGTGAGETASRFIINTHTNYRLDNATTVFFTVKNLFNKQYQDVNDYPANGFAFMLGVKRSF